MPPEFLWTVEGSNHSQIHQRAITIGQRLSIPNFVPGHPSDKVLHGHGELIGLTECTIHKVITHDLSTLG